MGQFVKGDVLVVPFPFTDLRTFKHRPALVLASFTGGDMIMCMITTPQSRDGLSIDLTGVDFSNGAIDHNSCIRPNRLFTFSEAHVVRKRGQLTPEKVQAVVSAIVRIIQT